MSKQQDITRSNQGPVVYLVDDDTDLCLVLERWLERQGFAVRTFHSPVTFLQSMGEATPGVVLLDLRMPEMDGFTLLEQLRERGLEWPILVLTASDTANDAFQAVRLGAYDYLVKPVDKEHLLSRVRNAAERLQLQERVARLESELDTQQSFHEIIGTSAGMQKVFRAVSKVAHSSISTYIHGESGTGKELIARAIHRSSPREKEPFVTINCAAIPHNLLESELFGHERGAFTGASSMRKGCFERAHGGTIFLDEIGELDLSVQGKLLRVLQEGSFSRVGGNREIKVDVRVICATHRNLEEWVADGRFRQDLYYRLAVYTLPLPPLRERVDDIPLLIQSFLNKYKHEAGKAVEGFTPEAMQSLLNYAWPGNVRELENVVRSAMVVSDAPRIPGEALPARLLKEATPSFSMKPAQASLSNGSFEPGVSSFHSVQSVEAEPSSVGVSHLVGSSGEIIPLAELEKQAILHALTVTEGNMELAAVKLKIGRATLYRRLASYEDVSLSDFKQKKSYA